MRKPNIAIFIVKLDQCDFLFPAPAFELFLPGNGPPDVPEMLVIDQTVAVMGFGETGDKFAFMLADPSLQIVGYADVNNLGGVGDDVYVIVFHMSRVILRLVRQVVRLRMTGNTVSSRGYLYALLIEGWAKSHPSAC